MTIKFNSPAHVSHLPEFIRVSQLNHSGSITY